MLDPRELYTLEPDVPSLGTPVLVHALSGYVDAGEAVRLAHEHLLSRFEHRVIARFDVDQLHDYRARRPAMIFDADHWESYADPELLLHAVQDAAGNPFLVLTGPEPDVQWERYVAAVGTLIEHFGVRLTIGLNAIPMAVPHTRPVGMTSHASRQELIPGNEPWLQRVQVPASASHLLEFRLKERGLDAIGFAVHVPHYVAQTEFPDAAERLVAAIATASGLVLPTDELRSAGSAARDEIDKQVADSTEAMALVSSLEQQYDAYLRGRGKDLLAADAADLPSADELGAELERFLADHTRRQRDDRDN
ncbi:MAG TPA: PAC2 family protein [Acidothermaceae bacterium]|nr:PAC2 family protein [Acidothermaceae bacterium]